MMKKFFTIICFFLLILPSVQAQRFSSRPRMSKQKLSRYQRFVDFSIGGGYHSMNIDLAEGGDKNGRFGATAGAYYRYAYWRNVHLFTGLGATLYSERSKYDNLVTEVYGVHPDNGKQYTFKAAFINWEEIQRTVNLELPVGAFYTNFINRSIWRFMVGGGVKLEIPIVKRYVTDNGSEGVMKRSGYLRILMSSTMTLITTVSTPLLRSMERLLHASPMSLFSAMLVSLTRSTLSVPSTSVSISATGFSTSPKARVRISSTPKAIHILVSSPQILSTRPTRWLSVSVWHTPSDSNL